VIGLEALEADFELPLNGFGSAFGRVTALADQDDVVSHAAIVQPMADHFFVSAVGVNESGVEGVSAGFEECVEHRHRMRKRVLIVAAHHEPGHFLVGTGGGCVFHAVVGTHL
jgi:hypothetical protein